MYLSASKIKLYDKCQRKFTHQYLLKTTPDYIEENNAFFYGSLLHRILENYNVDDSRYEMFVKALNSLEKEYTKMFNDIQTNQVEFDLLYAKMLIHIQSYELFLASNPNLKIVKKEQKIELEHVTSIIDAIVIINDKWYIIDYKTTAALDSLTKYRLYSDNQLCLYASLHTEIEKRCPELKNSVFGGVAYLEFVKTTMKFCSKAKTVQEFINKVLDKNPLEKQARFTIVPVENIDFENFRSEFNKYYNRILKLKEDVEAGVDFGDKNKDSCNTFGICPFFSQCYDKEKKATDFSINLNISEVLALPF